LHRETRHHEAGPLIVSEGVSLGSVTGWDWFVILVLSGSVLLGLWRGLIRTVFGLAAWVIALVGGPVLTPLLVERTGMQEHVWVVLVLLMLALLIGTRLIGAVLARAVSKVGLGIADRGLGGVLGALRAFILILLAATAAHVTQLDQRHAWREAHTRPLLDAIVSWVAPYLPERMSGIRRT
jgi:membrane protein required for colicin V production